MNERTATLNYKARVAFTCEPEASSFLLGKALHLVHEHVTKLTDFHIPFHQFQSHAALTFGKNIKVFIASCREAPPLRRFLWAIKLQIPDTQIKRRRWVHHIALRYENNREASLHYAEIYQDFTLGSFVSLTMPQKQTPDLVRDFVRNKEFHCIVGNYRLPTQTLTLNETGASIFLGMLNDAARTIPIILVTCPDTIDTGALSEALLANGIVFAAKEREVIEVINSFLPEAIKVNWGTVQVFPAGKSYVQVLQNEMIIRMTNPVIQMRHAYCECMSTVERQEFPTYDELILLRNSNRLSEMTSRINRITKENVELCTKNETLGTQCGALEQSLLRQSALIGRDGWEEAELYEKEWSKSQQECNAMKEQIREITMALYTRQTPSLAGIPQCAAIGHLLEAIKFSLGPAPPSK